MGIRAVSLKRNNEEGYAALELRKFEYKACNCDVTCSRKFKLKVCSKLADEVPGKLLKFDNNIRKLTSETSQQA